MIKKEEMLKRIENDELNIKALINGSFGTGKTFFSMTFPKYCYCQIEPHGLQTAITTKKLFNNMVYYDDFTPSSDEDIGKYFERLDKFIINVREEVKKGNVRSFIFDNLTHFTQARWMYVEKYEKVKTKSGSIDTRAMYGNLTRFVFKFMLTKVITLPCHVLIPVHTMDEQEEDAATGKVQKTGQVITNTLGGFRNDAAGMVNANLFLDIKRKGEQHIYRAQCLPDGRRNAKNNLGLPMYVENICYETIMNSIERNLKGEKNG